MYPTRARCFHPSIIDRVCFPRFRSPCFSAPKERGQSVDRSHTVEKCRISLCGFRRGIQPQPDRPGESASRGTEVPSTALQRYQLFLDQRTTVRSRASKIRQTEGSRLMLNRLVTEASIRVSLTSLPDVILFKHQDQDEERFNVPPQTRNGFTSHLRRGRFYVTPQTRTV